jgi:hypothetical protein
MYHTNFRHAGGQSLLPPPAAMLTYGLPVPGVGMPAQMHFGAGLPAGAAYHHQQQLPLPPLRPLLLATELGKRGPVGPHAAAGAGMLPLAPMPVAGMGLAGWPTAGW